MDRTLVRLCRAYGIAIGHPGAAGRRQTVSEATARALLGAMGVDASSPEQARTSLQTHLAQRWERPLQPVHVLYRSEPLELQVSLPGERPRGSLTWTLTEESGRGHDGVLPVTRLAAVERGQVQRRRYTRYRLRLPVTLPEGYHRLELSASDGGRRQAQGETRLIVTPGVCYQPEALAQGARIWGPSVALATLRSARNWGIGDYTDLTRLIELWSGLGAGIAEVGPLHALFPDEPERVDPHVPSSRLGLNVLYLDVEAIADFPECPEALELVRSPTFQAQLRALRASEEVRYAEVAGAKRQVLELLYASFRGRHLHAGSARAQAFRAYQAERGDELWRHALFEALREHLHGNTGPPATWPVAYQAPAGAAVAEFAAEHLERLELFQYLQWQADQQIATAGRRSWELGLGVGICQGFALGPAADGAEAWARPEAYARGTTVATPADSLSPWGQAWMLAPGIPFAWREEGYAALIAALRHSMRHAGALRIDRIAGFKALPWAPRGGSPQDAAYVRYPLREILGVIALESRRSHCVVIGEDLGPLPARLREALKEAGVFSYGLLCASTDEHGQLAGPEQFPAQSLVCATAPGLPGLPGYWQGADLDLCTRLGLFPSERTRDDQVVARAQDRARLLVALDRQGLLPAGTTVHPVSVPEVTPAFARAVHVYLARSPAQLLAVRLEDVLGHAGTLAGPRATEPEPGWRRRLALDLEQWGSDEHLLALAEALRAERGSAAAPRVPAGSEAAPPREGARVPRATYRLQLHRGFTFADATALVAYLAELGVSHCYLSPILRARPGSTHGYDIVDHGAVNPELGGESGFEQLVATLHQHRMGVVLDIVPNHMGVMGSDNAWWLDVLENGPAGAYARFFDIDWDPVKDALRGKVLVPVLGDHYGHVLDRGELRVGFDPDEGAFSLLYFQHRLPVDPRTYPVILAPGLGRLEARLGAGHPQLLELTSLMTAYRHLAPRAEGAFERVAERQRDKALHKQHLGRLYRESADVAWYIDECLRELNGSERYPADPERLHQLLEVQAFRPAYWRVAADDINYRRFFDINDLASLRMEEEAVFEATHRLVRELLRRGLIDGLRVDHPDGLYDPQQYFVRLQAMATVQAPAGLPDGPPSAPIWLVVEKILAPHERLREAWPVHGTTGYEFASLCGGVLIDARAAEKLDRTYRGFLGKAIDPDDLLYRSKSLIMKAALASELNVLATQLSRIAESDRHTRDYTQNSLRAALREVVACFPVYRTYVSEAGAGPEDLRHVDWAVAVAKRRSQAADTSVFDFVRDVLVLRAADGKGPEYRAQVVALALKFQQYTAPVQAKGLEDTAFYVYNRLVSLNEVGGDPRRFGVSLAAFHRANAERARRWPHAMLSTSTHDSKRSEDVRARIHALSELADEWRAHLARWRKLNRGKRRVVEGVPAPTRNDEYLLYQTLLGAWPSGVGAPGDGLDLRDRIQAYMLKAVREAKVASSWVNPNREYEEAVAAFVGALLENPEGNPFLVDLLPFQRRVAMLGRLNSLTQTLLKLTCPGVPDLYQGSEAWDLSLVDPDNRRPVDWERRRRLLAQAQAIDRPSPQAQAEAVQALLERMEDGAIKLYLIWRTLSLRRRHPALFRDGGYRPLAARGEREGQVIAFARTLGAQALVVVAGRLFASLTDGGRTLPLAAVWGDTAVELPDLGGRARNVFTGEALGPQGADARGRVELRRLFAHLPFAILIA
jgi:(1->4)-alpha-D-glucan 1-alpha-D-glucosylmutase